MKKHNPLKSDLLEMLTYRRPAGSTTEAAFRQRYLLSLPGAYEDQYGNIHVQVGQSRVLWSCHTDTVHRAAGRQGIQRTGSFVHLPPGSASDCLGADDTVGVYLLRSMIRRRVPGNYIFHYGEEIGGIGASALAKHHPAFLRQEYDCAIALDRAGTKDIVTHQLHRRTCSDAFSVALASALADLHGDLQYRAAHGVYTDTAEYAKVIPECSNLSVGYGLQHSRQEYVDLRHVDKLLGALCDLDPSQLVIARDPSRPETTDWRWLIEHDTDDLGVADYASMTAAERRAWDVDVAPSADDYMRMNAAERRGLVRVQ